MKTVKTLTLLTICVASISLADDFTTVDGKEYKNATITRVEPDGVVLKHRSGISKVYFTELPKEVQEQTAQYTARQQAQSIRIPYIEFHDATFREAVDVLREQGVENDTGGTGVN